MPSINNKLKAAVKKSLKESKQPESKEDLMKDIGIESPKARPKELVVYKLWWHPRATLDHVKYPKARWKPVPDSPMYATYQDGEKACRKLEKEHRDTLYSVKRAWVPKPTIPKALLKKIEVRGW